MTSQEGFTADEHSPSGARDSQAKRPSEPLILMLSVSRDELRGCEALLADALRALRLFGGGGISLHPLAWIEEGEDSFAPLALSFTKRPHGTMLLLPDQEDELRAFVSLIAKRAPTAAALQAGRKQVQAGAYSPSAKETSSGLWTRDPIAWALRRFEIGCEAPHGGQGLTDHLLALQALLEPTRNEQGLLAARLSALCAPPAQRRLLAQRMLDAIALERELITGQAQQSARQVELAREVSEWLRALLADVICGHLHRDLVALADELLLQGGADARHAQAPGGAGAGEVTVRRGAVPDPEAQADASEITVQRIVTARP